MEKVKLTQEQADAIEEVLKQRTKDSIVRERANVFLRGGMYIGKSNHIVFYEMELEKIIKALYIGYEVEETFEVGDWVAYNYWGLVGKVVCTVGGIALDNRVSGKLNPKDFKRATPEEIAKEKERRWWKSNNRDVWELREGDIILPNRAEPKDVTVFVVKEINDNYVFSESESYIHITSVKDSWKVICFAEDRKDV